ncbi:hypothetical protein EW146_g7354 [Bondarzewia mesenterica]|uniref:Homeobox domain-containing protein n=1 Tax=Bondarzewia mesenterica TaxID=1095465 RepID=A0A4S4LL08_9AGAM|nr:hypothetical protein EW146_g7354 [Bondarzewia mesenterica]
MRPPTRSTRSSSRSLSEHAISQSRESAKSPSLRLLLPQTQSHSKSSSNAVDAGSTAGSAAPNISSTKPGEHLTERKARHRMTDRQLQMLEALFQQTTHPTKEEKAALARDFKVDVKTVTVWFQNKRQTMKRHRDSRDDASAVHTLDHDFVAPLPVAAAATSPQTPFLSSNAAHFQLSGPGFPGYFGFAAYPYRDSPYQDSNSIEVGMGMAPTPTFANLEFVSIDPAGPFPNHRPQQPQPQPPVSPRPQPELDYPAPARPPRHALTLVHREPNIPRTPNDDEAIPRVHPNPRSHIHTRSSSRKENIPPQELDRHVIASPLSFLYRQRQIPILDLPDNAPRVDLRPRTRDADDAVNPGLDEGADAGKGKRTRTLEWACDRDRERATKRRRDHGSSVVGTGAELTPESTDDEELSLSGLGLGISRTLDSGSAFADWTKDVSTTTPKRPTASSSLVPPAAPRARVPSEYYADFSADVVEGAVTLLSLKQSGRRSGREIFP